MLLLSGLVGPNNSGPCTGYAGGFYSRQAVFGITVVIPNLELKFVGL